MLDKKNFYINGKWIEPSKPNDFEVIDPSTEEPLQLYLWDLKRTLIKQSMLPNSF